MFKEMKEYHDKLRQEGMEWSDLTLEQRLFCNEFHIVNQYNTLLNDTELYDEIDRNYIMVLLGIKREYKERLVYCEELYNNALNGVGVL